MSRILSRISMFTGQISSHALHDVHAQISSAEMRSNTELAEMVSSASCPMTGDTGPAGRVAAMTLPTLVTISRGSSGFPVAWAGHTEVHRPQIVQASVSSSCFHVKSSIAAAPKLSSSVSIMLGSGFIAPLGRSRSRRYMFNGDVSMWRALVIGTSTRKVTNPRKCAVHSAWWVVDSAECDTPSNAAESGYPTIDHLSKVG